MEEMKSGHASALELQNKEADAVRLLLQQVWLLDVRVLSVGV